MSNIKITLPDKSVKEVSKGITPQDIASLIGPGLSEAVVVSRIDGVLMDLNTKIKKDCNLELFTGETSEGHDTLLHSTAHLMAQAVRNYFQKQKYQ